MNVNFNLTKEELDEINGGSGEPGGFEDVNNLNKVNGCVCWYNNHGAVTNTNDVIGCLCSCT